MTCEGKKTIRWAVKWNDVLDAGRLFESLIVKEKVDIQSSESGLLV